MILPLKLLPSSDPRLVRSIKQEPGTPPLQQGRPAAPSTEPANQRPENGQRAAGDAETSVILLLVALGKGGLQFLRPGECGLQGFVIWAVEYQRAMCNQL